jgi:hypothetical protein
MVGLEGGCSVDFCNTRTWRFSYRKVKGLPVKGLLLGEGGRGGSPQIPPVLERGQRRQEGTTDKHTHMSDEEEVIVIVD